MIDLSKIRRLLPIGREGDEIDDSRYYELINKQPAKIEWASKPRARWVIAYNPATMYKTTSDVFSSEMAVYNFPIGLTNMSVPKRFIPSDHMVHLMYAMEWLGADVRPESKYRKLRRPGVVELIFG